MDEGEKVLYDSLDEENALLFAEACLDEEERAYLESAALGD